MKTTLDLPNELVKEMKLRAVHEGRKLKDVASEIFRRGLDQAARVSVPREKRVKLPLIQCRHKASPSMEITADKATEILLKQEVESAS